MTKAKSAARAVLNAQPPAELAATLKGAKLTYVSDLDPGLGRKRAGKGFSFIGLDGRAIKAKEHLARLKALAIPPAWREVWIAPAENAHVQATGRDERGRKQYIYHAQWGEYRDAAKFEHMLVFGKLLPRIRRRVARDLSLPGLPKDKVLAVVVRLLETTLIRIGNSFYAEENGSYGLTTLRKRHVDVSGTTVEFDFVGKSGKDWEIELKDARLAKIIRRCEELPGYRLFKYVDEDGETRSVESDDVNQYLKEITGEDVTAKDFRTWAGTVAATLLLTELEPFVSKTQATKNVTGVIKSVAKRLGNTPAICRKSYVHPNVVTCYLEGTLAAQLIGDETEAKPTRGLYKEERSVLAFLRRLEAAR